MDRYDGMGVSWIPGEKEEIAGEELYSADLFGLKTKMIEKIQTRLCDCHDRVSNCKSTGREE